MAITAKPSSYTLNSGATYYPDHLWLINEGSGTTLTDVIGGKVLNLSGPAWDTDGTHGPFLEFAGGTDVATIEDQATPIFGITTSFTVAVLMKHLAKSDGTAEGLAFIYNNASGTGKFGLQVGGQGYSGFVGHQTGGTSSARTGTTYGALDTEEWVLAMGACNSTGTGELVASANGSGDNDVFATTNLISNSGTMDSFGLGAIFDSSPANYFTGQIAAVALWVDTYYDEATQLSIYNGGDIWASLGVQAVTTQAFQYQNRVNTLLRM